MVRTQERANERGSQKTVYIKPDVEKKAIAYCQTEKISFSLLIKLALEEYLKKQEG